MSRSLRLVFALVLLLSLPSAAAVSADPRPLEPMNAGEIRLGLERMRVVGSALYVGAHPDDENTAMLAWLQNGKLVRTAYLSLTRGDGGQNLLGTEFGDRLGVIRTQELLAARRIDGAEQRFTRAVDFGFSKNPDETLQKWGHDRILEDVVWTIRRNRPDVIITRFPPDSTAGHGHHQASAILAAEAFRAAADPARFPDQLQWVQPWQAKRLVWNVFRFGAQGPDTTRGRLSVDLGAYNALLGKSYSELAGLSRSMHKSQGFGAAERRGEFVNTFVVQDGAPASRDLFDGVDLTWNRVPGGERVAPLLDQALREYDPEHPEASLPMLLRVHGVLATMGTDPLVLQKRAELVDLLRSCAGIWLEATATGPSVTPGGTLRLQSTILGRVPTPLEVERVELLRGGVEPEVLSQKNRSSFLMVNRAITDTFNLPVPLDLEPSQPYWLRRATGGDWTDAPDPLLIGTPENLPRLAVKFWLRANGEHFQLTAPLVYRWVDPVAGERYRMLDVLPPATVALDRTSYLFPDRTPRPVEVTVSGSDQPVAGTLRLELPEGWKATPAGVPMSLVPGRRDTIVRFTVTPPAAAATGSLHAFLELESGRRLDRSRVTIDYPHIPVQTLLPPAEARVMRADLVARGKSIGYVMGSGDRVPDALAQMGFAVTPLSDEDLERGDLARFPAIVIGVRAYNTRPRLLAAEPRLLDWVAKGGRLVVQYQTPDRALDDRLGPLPFKVSRDRVTVEEAPVTFVQPASPLLNVPNKITAADFTGWVQERGLWFANPVDAGYATPLACHDPGEPDRKGGLIVAKHGKGTFVYTGYAFFRQLPAGVPGAWRLFANLVSTGS